MGIRQRKEVAGQPWVYDYKDPATGKRKMATPKSGLKKDALALKRQIDFEIATGVHTPSSETVTIERLANLFLDDFEQRRKDGRITAGYALTAETAVRKHLIGHMGKKRLTEIQVDDVLSLYRKMIASGLKPRTARARLSIFGRVEALASRRGLTKRTVFKEAMVELRGIPSGQIRTFDLTDVRKLLDTSSTVRWCELRRQDVRSQKWLHLSINLAAFCGLRWGEVFGLTLESIDFDNNVIKVRRSLKKLERSHIWGLGKGTKTAAGQRDIPMPKHIRDLLTEWCDWFYIDNPDRLIFTLGERSRPGPKGGKVGALAGTPIKPTAFHSHWARLLDAAGLGKDDKRGSLHFHALRHFASALMVENHIPLTDVAGLMGHKSFDLTLQVYAHSIVGGHKRHAAFEGMAQAVHATELQLMPPSD